MLLNLSTFSGEVPRLAADALPPASGQYVKDCEFANGDLRGILGNSLAFNSGFAVKGMYLHGPTGNWYAWPQDVDAVQGPVVDDQYSRFYYTLAGSGLRVSRGDTGGSGASPTTNNTFLVGVPAPAAAPVQVTNTQAFPDGVTGYAFKALCSAGATSTPAEVASSVVTNESGAEYTMTVTGACGTVAGNGTTLYAVGESREYSGDGLTRWPVSSTSSNPAVASGLLYVKPTGIDATTITLWFERSDGQGAARVFYRQTTGWYSTTNGSSPVDPTETSAGTLSFELTVTLDSGDPVKLAVPMSSPVYLPSDIGDGKWRVSVSKQSETVFKFFVNTGGYVDSRAYVYTHTNLWGEESAPSPPLILDTKPGIPVKLSLWFNPLPGYQTTDRLRIYRTATGSQATEYQFVEEISSLPAPGATTSVAWTDTVEGSKLGEVLSTLGYGVPPSDLTGIIALPNGVMCAFTGSDLWFSEPYLPYAWKSGNSMSFPNRIVGICAYENSVFVTTTANPWLVNGVSPDSMSQMVLPEIQAGVSKNSIVQIGSNVAYLSHDGIVMARGLDTTVGQSLQLFTRKSWRDRYANHLSQARLSAHDGALICTFDNGAEGFILRGDEAAGTFSRYSPVVNAAAIWPENDWLYFSQGNAVYAHKGSPNSLPFVWHSKDMLLPKPHNFGCCQVRGSGSATFEFYVDGTLKHTKTLTLTERLQMFRLPSGFVGARWSVRITGAAGAIIKQVLIATSPKELQGV